MPTVTPFYLLLVLASFGFTSVEASDLRSLEKRLQKYLDGRILVFRQPNISGTQVKFDSQGRVRGKRSESPSGRTGILYLDVKLDSERLIISGESMAVEFKAGKPVLRRDIRTLKLMTCTVVLDSPPNLLTFKKLLGVLARVFLTQQEFRTMAQGGSI